MAEKIRIAFVKFGGLSAGGTEKYLQTIAANLPKDRFEVDYFYCDAAPYVGSDYKHSDTDPLRVKFMEDHGINLIKFDVGAKNIQTPTHDWVNTNFWDVFKEEDYHIVQTGRAGHPEYPFNKMNKVAIVDSIHLTDMADDRQNIARVILISEEQKTRWVKVGGNASKVVVIPAFAEEVDVDGDYREQLGISKDDFVFGLHQRDSDNIYSPIPLAAFNELKRRHPNIKFVLLGGSDKYKAQDEGDGSVYFLPFSSDLKNIHKFLNTLDVYTHGRADGEVCSAAIIEGLMHSLPVVTHAAPNMGHAAQVDNGAGYMCFSKNEYVAAMEKLLTDKSAYKTNSELAYAKYQNNYSRLANVNKIAKVYEDVYKEVLDGKYYSDHTCSEDWLLEWVDGDED